MKTRYLLYLIVLLPGFLKAQVPEKFSYQFVIRNAANVLLANAPVGIRFSILQDSITGNVVYAETHLVTTNMNGLATLHIGGGTPIIGTMSGINWGTGSFFIKTETDPDGGTNYSITGTSQLLSVPYSLHARTADSLLGGIPLQTISLSNDTIFLSNGSSVKLPEVVSGVSINNDSLYITYTSGLVVNAGSVGNGTVNSLLPSVTTLGSSNITYTTAHIQAMITNTGNEFIIGRGICLSANPDPGLSDTVFINGQGAGSFNTVCNQLLPNTTYYVRAFATNNAGTGFGNEISFTTSALVVPSLTTYEVTNITNNSAEGGGELTDDGGSTVLSYGLCWWLNPAPTLSDSVLILGSGMTNFTGMIMGLSQNTTYHVRAWASNAQGTGYGNEIIFTTDTTILIMINTLPVSNISYHQATGGGNVISNGGVPLLERGICWAKHASPTLSDFFELDAMEPGQQGLGNYSNVMGGLDTNTTYYVRAFATNLQGTTYGNQQSFTTLSIPVVTLITTPVSNITGISATSGGQVTNDGGASIGRVGICWSVNPMPTEEDPSYFLMENPPGNAPFTGYLTNLEINATYYVRSFAETTGGFFYGNQVSFTTSATLPLSITTTPPFSITNTSAVSGGTIIDGGQAVLDKGVIYSLSDGPNFPPISAGPGAGTFTVAIGGLGPGGDYAVKAYATNANGTFYGNEVFFSTTALPELGTNPASFINYDAAVVGGNITNDFNRPVFARGVCWSTSPDPTFPASQFELDAMGGTGTYSVTLSGLQQNTLYYAKAFAVSSAGIGYGQQISFATLLPGLATVMTEEVTAITFNAASSGGQIISDGGSPISDKGICWSTHPSPTITDSFASNGPGAGNYISSLTGLNASTVYYVRAFVSNASGIAYGNELTFISAPPPSLPVVGTSALTLNNNTLAEGGGFVSMDGGMPVTARGICWSLNPLPTIADDYTNDGSGIGSFSSLMTVTPGCATYYVRAYATNSVGTAYGNQQSVTFGTLHDVMPVSITNISYYSADVSGAVISGGCPILERGICWHFAPGPTTLNNKMSSGAGAGGVFASISGLLANKTYYVRAYAISAEGITYGNEEVFTTATPTGYYIGQSFGGGIIYYIDGSGQHGLICAANDQGFHAWGCEGINITTDTLVGAGASNTAAIIATCAEPGIAARICDNLVLNGYSDWYLPSLHELSLIYTNLVATGVLLNSVPDAYSSSSQNTIDWIWTVRFDDGSVDFDGKSNDQVNVRAVRGF